MNDNQIIYGIHPIIEALREGKVLDKILIQNTISNDSLSALKQEIRLSNQNIQFQYVPIEKLDKMSNNQNHQGVVAIASFVSYQDLEKVVNDSFDKKEVPFLVYLDHITDVRNLGAIARTCECAGVTCLVLPNEGSAQINQDSIKTSAGALLRLPICKVNNIKTALNFLHQVGVKVISATEKTNNIYTNSSYKEPLLLILGAEDKGISKDCLKLSDEMIKIPLKGEIESLNVSVSAGIIIYEILRQRELK